MPGVDKLEDEIRSRRKFIRLVVLTVIAFGIVTSSLLIYLYMSLNEGLLLLPALLILAMLPVDVGLVYHLMKSSIEREADLLRCIIRLLGEEWALKGDVISFRLSGGYLAIRISGRRVEIVRVTGGWAEPVKLGPLTRYKIAPLWGSNPERGSFMDCNWTKFEGRWEVRVPNPIGEGDIRIVGGSCVAIRARCLKGVSCSHVQKFIELISSAERSDLLD